MQESGGLRPAAAAALTALTAAVIVYGSLFPFRFEGPAQWRAAAEALLASWPVLTSRGDIASNLLLYTPLGFFGARAAARLSPAAAILLTALAGAALSIAIELLQYRLTWRSTAMSDVYMNCAGCLAGALAGALLPLALGRAWAGREPGRGFAGLALTAWLGWRLFPYVPALDWRKVESALLPLLAGGRPPALESFRHFAAWIAAAMLLEGLLGPQRRRLAFAALVAAVLGLRCLIVGVVLTPAEVLGAGAALLLWSAGLAGLESRARIALALLAAAIALGALEPFVFMAQPRPFSWTPFRSMLVGSAETNARAFLEKSFLYAALLWLLLRSGLRFVWATLIALAFVAALKWGQTWLPRRSGEITDVAMVAILALVLLLSGGARRRAT